MDENNLPAEAFHHFPINPGVVVIHLVDPNTVLPETAQACLTSEEQSRADRFRFRKDAIHWAACRASLRRILGKAIRLPPQDVPLKYLEFGKPVLASPYNDLHFNLSHSANLAAIALSIDGPVGIDLEAKERAPDLLECESTFCHPAEILRLSTKNDKRALQLLEIWTAKEAFLKALGTGLSFSPTDIRIDFEDKSIHFFSDKLPLNASNQRLINLIDQRMSLYQSFVSHACSATGITIVPW
jgi:4'-phosphopantetheinyl transferase